MSVSADRPEEGFRFSQLIYDTRYRSYTIQIFALIVIMLAFAWLLNNAVVNLERLGKTFEFGFLWETASYDINQRLIDYDSTSTHGRAALVGILNTLLVAVLGCITATVVGVIAGVLRLSKNWLIARLMTVYIESFRNVPVLIWILIVVAAINETLPPPAAYRGEDGMSGYLWESVFLTNRGFYIPIPVFGEGSTVVVVGFLISCVAIWFFSRWARKRQDATGQILPVFRINLALFFLPALLLYFIAGMPITLEDPVLRGFNFQGGIFMRDSLIGLWLALSIYTGAFVAEIVRAGILSVSKGQTEAAFALGLRPNRTMNLVILPQALRVIVPPLISQYLNLTKNSSLAIAVGYMDATGTLGGITLNQTGREMETMLLLMSFYLVVSLSISAVMNAYNERVKLRER
ncbi:amino acid ABC transporter permease [Minwuia thermotolerans]|uniref:Amino acid ABC transporter permease n=1 Tax=Minwuia thermotolerans TaxID=2056226 RepID=A0A2M9G1J6_9PROT|nr:amino acid ABC transporter permease [Minwuia thermotolerans]